jgi:hypothetical protein
MNIRGGQLKDKPRWLKFAAIALLFGLVGTSVQYLQGRIATSGGAVGSQLDSLHARCVQDMVANTCKVMGTGSATGFAKPGNVVFVAGVGPIDAVAYEQMYSAGDAMCTVVKSSCAKRWDGPQCLTARKLWSGS